MADIVFQVVDTGCEQLNRNNFTPAVKMATASVTSVKTRRGYPAFTGGDSVLYKKATHSGEALSWLWTFGGGAPSVVPVNTFVAGSRWVYSGATEINATGQYVSHHSKALHTPTGANSPMLIYDLSFTSGGVPYVSAIKQIYGFCAQWDQPSETFSGCGGTPTTADQVDTLANGWAFASQWGGKALIDFPPVVPLGSAVSSVTETTRIIAGDSLGGSWFLKEFFPLDWGSPIIGYDLGVTLVGRINYTVTLSDPFTADDLDASTVTYQGDGATALKDSTYQRYVVYDVVNIVERHIAVAFTFTCTNLIPGENYRITYALEYHNAIVFQVYDFEADATTKVITGSVPTPAEGRTITVKTPAIAYLT